MDKKFETMQNSMDKKFGILFNVLAVHCTIANDNAEQKELKCSYSLSGNIVSFELEKYDPQTFSTLDIDPTVSRIWGTYFGRESFDYFTEVTVDNDDNIFASGCSGTSSTLLATSGAYQVTCAGWSDGLLVKFDSSGNRLWSTYYGGNDIDSYNGITRDATGHLLLCGNTKSTTGIIFGNAVQATNGGQQDGFITRFDSTGFPVWSTYFGGSGNEYFLSVTKDSQGNVYASGETSSSSSIASAGAFQTTFGGGSFDGFFVKLDTAGDLLWSSYYGGTATDEVDDLDIVGDTILYLVGKTSSTSGISTPGSYQSTNAGTADAFLANFDTAGTRRWCTYYGGPAADGFIGVSHSSSGYILLVGSSTSLSGIVSPGAFQTTSSGSESIIGVFNPDGTRDWMTYYGGTDTDAGYDITKDSQDNLVVSGRSMSQNGISTSGSWQQNHFGNTQIGGDKLDGYVVKFTPFGTRVWGTYYGGDYEDICEGVAVDHHDRVVACGHALSANNIASSGAFQTTLFQDWDAFVVRFDQLTITTGPVSSPFCAGSTINVSFNAIGDFGPTETFTAQLSDASGSFANPITIGTISGVTTGTITATVPTSTPGGSGYRIRVYSVDRGVADFDNGSNLTIWPYPTVTLQLFPAICIDDPVIPLPLTGPGGQPAGGTFAGAGVDTAGNFDPAVAGPGNHIITYTYTDIHNCSTQTASTIVNVATHTTVTFNPINSVCVDASPFTLNEGQPAGGLYFGTGVTNNQFDPSASGAGTFTISYYYTTNSVCLDSASQTITVFPLPPVPVITNNNTLLSTTATGSLQWYFNSTLLVGQTSSTLQAMQNGNYQVEVTDSNGCSSMSTITVVNNVGIPQLLFPDANISVYPNPFSDHLTLGLNINSKSELSVALFDVCGRAYETNIHDETFLPGKYSENVFAEGVQLPTGVYLMRVTINGESNWARVVKQ
ncbi:MAG TPA: T9SS type A sorting domain-containing protein [Bacteroidia bacterium]|nr:T9SS type A sorting domain-containing protein [Bacteroidia bacterium]